MTAWVEPTAATVAARFPSLARNLSADDLEALVAALTMHRVRRGEVLLSQGSPHPRLFLLWSGVFALQTTSGDVTVDLGPFPPNSIVGDIAFFDGGPVTASVVATTQMGWALGIEDEVFAAFASERPAGAAGVCRAVSETLAQRLREATERYEVLRHAQLDEDNRAQGVRDVLRSLFGVGRAS